MISLRSLVGGMCIFSCTAIFSENTSNSTSLWDCGRTDIPVPINQLEISNSRSYIIHSFHFLFYHFLDNSDQMYVDALVSVANKNYDEAEHILQSLLEKYPQYEYGYIQLGYIYLWSNQYKQAYQMFKKAHLHCKCENSVLSGLRLLSIKVNTTPASVNLAYDINQDLLSCEPDAFKYKYNRAVLLIRLHRDKEAEEALLDCMSIAPEDSDVILHLGNLYYRQSKYDQADAIYAKCPERYECVEGRAKIALARGDYKLAEYYFKSVLVDDSGNEEALLGLAQTYAIEQKFTDSQAVYEELLTKYSKNYRGWQELYEVNLHADKALNYNISYFEAKENDPNIKKPVARDYYFDNNIIAFFPITDLFRLDVKAFFAFQKEKNILPSHPGVNYYAQIGGIGLISHYFFTPHWKWEAFVNIKAAWNIGHSFFPFQNTQRVEPGTSITFSTDDHFFTVGADVDSYVIKNFSKNVSQLLTLRSVETLYRYKAPVRWRPEFEGLFQETYIISQPHNRRDTEAVSFRFLVPYVEQFLKLFYTYEHRHFNKLNINYYSFHQQWRNTAGLSVFYNSVQNGVSFDVTYWYRAQKTKDLYQPIGDLIYITPMQYLNCNQVQATCSYRQKDYLKFEVTGGYYRDTLPYRVWNVQSSLYWLF